MGFYHRWMYSCRYCHWNYCYCSWRSNRRCRIRIVCNYLSSNWRCIYYYCLGCTAVTGSLAASGTGTAAVAAATLTCTTAGDSRVSACAADKKKTVGAAGAMDTCADACLAGTWDKEGICTTHTVCGNQVAGGARTATTAGSITADAVCAVCTAGTYGLNSGDCTNCVAVANSLAASTDPVVAAATLTCTSNSDSQVSACAAAHWKDTSGDANVCSAHTVCGKQVIKVGETAAAVRATTTAGSATADTVCAACSTRTYGLNSGDCTNCVAVTNA